MNESTSPTTPCKTCVHTAALMELLAYDAAVYIGRESINSPPMPCVLCSDTFYYATADGEPFPLEKAGDLLSIYNAHGDNGLICWAIHQRGQEPIPEIRETNWLREVWGAMYGKESIPGATDE